MQTSRSNGSSTRSGRGWKRLSVILAAPLLALALAACNPVGNPAGPYPNDPNHPFVSSLTFLDGSGGWQLTADGGVFSWGSAPFFGSYPGLPAQDRQGDRTFAKIVPRGDGVPGYVLVSAAGERYAFSPSVTPGSPPKTTSPTTPPAKGDPPTSVTVTSSANPATIGDVVTYTIVVASTAIPNTTGQLLISDNGVPLAGCDPIPNPTYEPNGSFVGTCSTFYGSAGTHLISAVFTGDSVFAQSAGAMSETVASTTTTTQPAPSGGGGGGGGGSAPAPTTTTTTAAPAPVIGLGITTPVGAQDSVNYLTVRYTSTASTTSNGAPATTASGTVTYYVDSQPVCSFPVGGLTSTVTCSVTFTQFGAHTLTVGYSDGVNTASTGLQNLSVTPPAITINNQWGVTAPTASPTATATLAGTTAALTITDANWEGVTSVPVTDQLGDACTATVSGTNATCSMTTTGTPTSFTLAYPGGSSSVGTQPVAPNGTQVVTTQWPARSVTISNPTVTIVAATAVWGSAFISAQLNWDPSNGHGSGTTPPQPIVTTNGSQLRLQIATTGNVGGDPFPLGTLAFTVTGGSYTATSTAAAGTSDCSGIQNFGLQAEGGCAITFSSAGSFTISAQYVSNDPNYSSVNLSDIHVTVS